MSVQSLQLNITIYWH